MVGSSTFSVLPADRYNTALVCHRWLFLACHPRLWLRVERPIKTTAEPGVFPTLEAAISAARLVVLFLIELIQPDAVKSSGREFGVLIESCTGEMKRQRNKSVYFGNKLVLIYTYVCVR